MSLRMGTWPRRIDEKGRFSLPAQVRRGVDDKRWVFGLDPEQTVVLFPQAALAGRTLGPDWHLSEADLDDQHRLTVPPEIKNSGKLQHEIKIVSAGEDHLKVINIEAVKQPAKKRRLIQDTEELRSFKSGEEANQWLTSGNPVAYYSRPDRVIVGRITSGNGTFFTLKGKDKSGTIVGLHQIPYTRFYPLDPADVQRESAITEEVIEKFPVFDPTWPDKIRRRWFDDFSQLLKHLD